MQCCWGRNQQQSVPTLLLQKPKSSWKHLALASLLFHPKLSLCSSPFLNELVEQMGFVPWLTSIPVFALEPVR